MRRNAHDDANGPDSNHGLDWRAEAHSSLRGLTLVGPGTNPTDNAKATSAADPMDANRKVRTQAWEELALRFNRASPKQLGV